MKKLQTILHILVGASLMSFSYPWITMPESRSQLMWGGLMCYFGLFIALRMIYYNGYNEGAREHLGNPKPIEWLPVNQVVRLRCALFLGVGHPILTLELPGNKKKVILVWDAAQSCCLIVGHWYCFDGKQLRPIPIGKNESPPE